MEKLEQVYDHTPESETGKFIIYFLNEDLEQSVDVVEAEKIDFEIIIQHLSHGGSVFIASRKKLEHEQEPSPNFPRKEFERSRDSFFGQELLS